MNITDHPANHPTAEMLSALHDGQLADDAVRNHVAGCANCSLEMHRLAAMSGLLANNAPSLSPISRARLHQQIDARFSEMFDSAMFDSAVDSALVRFGMRISGVAASILLIGSIWLVTANLSARQSNVVTQAAPPWVGVAVSSDADTIVRNAATPAAAVYLADASSSDSN